MSELSALQETVHQTYAVNADGSRGDLVSTSESRYSVPGIAFASVNEALAFVAASDATPDVQDDEAALETVDAEGGAGAPAPADPVTS